MYILNFVNTSTFWNRFLWPWQSSKLGSDFFGVLAFDFKTGNFDKNLTRTTDLSMTLYSAENDVWPTIFLMGQLQTLFVFFSYSNSDDKDRLNLY